MFFHLTNVQAPGKVVIKTAYTDCFVISHGCVCFELGVQAKIILRYIDINQLHTTLGQSLCDALPVYHAFIGCDYTASFSRRRKVTPLNLFEGDISVQNAFFQLGIFFTNLHDDIFAAIESFIRTMYVKETLNKVGEVRLQIFYGDENISAENVHKEWRKRWWCEIKKTRVVDGYFSRQITKSEAHTCEKHFNKIDTEIYN